MKVVQNRKVIFVCPKRGECLAHYYTPGIPCGHDVHHTRKEECLCEECHEFTGVQCHWEGIDETSTEYN